MVKVYTLKSLGADDLGEEVGTAILFEDGGVVVRRQDDDGAARLYEDLNEAEHCHREVEFWDEDGDAKSPAPRQWLDPEVVQREIVAVCTDLAEFLVQKNQAYGNSVLDPVRIFYKGTSLDGAKVRIDDKLNRLMKGHAYPGDNDVKDLAGYLVLMMVGKRLGLADA